MNLGVQCFDGPSQSHSSQLGLLSALEAKAEKENVWSYQSALAFIKHKGHPSTSGGRFSSAKDLRTQSRT